MKVAIYGLPQSGKTTLYKYLASIPLKDERLPKQVALNVNDERLQILAREFESEKIVTVEFMLFEPYGDITSDGRSFEPIRPSDALIWQIRGYDGGYGKPNPIEDFQMLKEIAIEKDLQVLNKRLETINSSIRKISGDDKKKIEKEKAAIEKIIAHLNDGKSVRILELKDAELAVARNYGLITAKPVLVNVSCDDDIYAKREELVAEFEKINQDESLRINYICTMPSYDMELDELDEEEALMFREDAGLETGIQQIMIFRIFESAEQDVYLTAGPKESRAWLIKKGATAVEAAGVIHSDIAQGFIRAEVLGWEDFIEHGSHKEARAKGRLRLEGKEYIVKDGDIMLFRFNV